MGTPEKRRAVSAMAKRWRRDEQRLAKLFGEYSEDDFSADAEMQRNIGTAIAHANSFLASYGEAA